MIYDGVVLEVHAYLQLRNVTFPRIIFPLYTLLQIDNYKAACKLHVHQRKLLLVPTARTGLPLYVLLVSCCVLDPRANAKYTTCRLE